MFICICSFTFVLFESITPLLDDDVNVDWSTFAPGCVGKKEAGRSTGSSWKMEAGHPTMRVWKENSTLLQRSSDTVRVEAKRRDEEKVNLLAERNQLKEELEAARKQVIFNKTFLGLRKVKRTRLLRDSG